MEVSVPVKRDIEGRGAFFLKLVLGSELMRLEF